MLRILADEDMPRPTAGLLQSLGIDAIDLRDAGLKGATDAEVFGYAQKQEMVIISRDKEFGNIVKYPLGTHHGII
jgi:predicted nuclease of predicted toxin-antitoxin system